MKGLIVFVLLMGLTSVKRDVEVIRWAVLEKYIQEKNETVKIINFWATWCKPCVEELPIFEKIQQQYKDKNVEVLLVSLDQASLTDKVKATLEKSQITARVVLLDEVDFNKWINKIDPNWSGSIPATLMINTKNEHRQFYEKQFSYQELEDLIRSQKP